MATDGAQQPNLNLFFRLFVSFSVFLFVLSLVSLFVCSAPFRCVSFCVVCLFVCLSSLCLFCPVLLCLVLFFRVLLLFCFVLFCCCCFCFVLFLFCFVLLFCFAIAGTASIPTFSLC